MKKHPDLRRLPKREQPGASNLPPKQAPAAPDQIERARVWSGDEHTVREMSDDQLSAALRTPLDDRARRRIEDEADRRDTAALLDRARPRGRLTDDLTGLSDDELGRLLPHVDTHDALHIAGEMDRRDVALRLPGVRADLVRLSDDQLAARVRDALAHGTDDVAELAAEAHRRDMLTRHFPGGHLVDDLSAVGDDELAWCMTYAEPDEVAQIAAEFDHRYPVELPPPAATGDAVADMLADRDALADAMDPVPDPDGWGALADDSTFWDDVKASAKKLFGDDEDQDERHKITRAEARRMYDEYVYRQYLAAVDATNGYLFNAKYRGQFADGLSLFSGPARIAFARASDELKEWWEQHGRLTQAEFIEQVTGKEQRWAAGARDNRWAEQQKR